MSLAAEPISPLLRTASRSVQRVVSELRRGDLVMLQGGDGRALLVRAAEMADAPALALVRQAAAQGGGGEPALVVTDKRAIAAGLLTQAVEPAQADPMGAGTVVIAPAPGPSNKGTSGQGLTPDLVRLLADPTRPGHATLDITPIVRPFPSAEGEALLLVKLARLLPAVVVAEVPAARAAEVAARNDLLTVRGADVQAYQAAGESTLRQVVEASVPLLDAEDTRLIAFRAPDGGVEHLAILIGNPDPAQPVLARLHSECFTGDLLGSLRCDCGAQLRGAIREIAAQGSGVVLYLAQEGRNIGLMNKLRAYRLQDAGVDTVDANLMVGFEADERTYLPAATMLKALGFHAVRLMTNNPDKLSQLARWGVQVVDRVPHIFPANGHNIAYLRTKAEKAGHLL
ncbi:MULTISPECIES: GTP cyclohydrolase II [Nitrospirillum]|uniref:GTP cyclohydrolase-2 n=1 Tax=Nitrospirillum amazonense TaxID=28077 RepID=A0A560FG40_9PROT|nr:GTP cyclohydrolase II [Nitrospirillum amazonense]MEC4594160.1 GTP cyclohydrolase II [Nitrospirillum amazonense]TWB20559.1 GTP cyclohydrolase II [Nitrospirillum amazonense]